MKKIVSIILTVMMLCSLCSVFAAADGADAGPFSNMGPGIANYNGDIYVTKSPSAEYLTAGGTAKFVSRATDNSSVSWYIADKDKTTIYSLDEASAHFSGLSVRYEDNSTVAVLENVPADMDGWQVQARFEGQNGPVYSSPASINIMEYPISPAAEWWWFYCSTHNICPNTGIEMK